MKDSSKNRLVNEIESRLDDFFGPDDNQPGVRPKDTLEKLKSIILNIDWEITDECLSDLIEEAEKLLPQYESDRMGHALLRMLRSLGYYIRKRKAQAHPDAIKRIMSVFESFDKIARHPEIDSHLKLSILSKEINAFKNLKQQVDVRRPVQTRPFETAIKPPDHDYKRLEQTMSSVEKRLRSEVEALKKQLANLQQELNSLRK